MPTHNTEYDFVKSMAKGESMPAEFIWPEEERASLLPLPELLVPEIDLKSFLSGNHEEGPVVDRVCRDHGIFLVKNHGVDMGMVEEAYTAMDEFFCMQLDVKQRARRGPGEPVGYSSSFVGRFSAKLPWKETLSLGYRGDSDETIENYLLRTMGDQLLCLGKVYDKYCRAMSKLSMEIMEVLGTSMGVGGSHFKEFFRRHDSILRLNYHPACRAPQLTLGTGPHTDPTSLTVLYQPRVPGLHVLVDRTWHSVAPSPHAFVVNVGDTLSALTNGTYKACMHRAVVSEKGVRKTMAFFLSPHREAVVRAAEEVVVASGGRRLYPDFKWPLFHGYTQTHYRCDADTLSNFSNWVLSQETEDFGRQT